MGEVRNHSEDVGEDGDSEAHHSHIHNPLFVRIHTSITLITHPTQSHHRYLQIECSVNYPSATHQHLYRTTTIDILTSAGFTQARLRPCASPPPRKKETTLIGGGPCAKSGTDSRPGHRSIIYWIDPITLAGRIHLSGAFPRHSRLKSDPVLLTTRSSGNDSLRMVGLSRPATVIECTSYIIIYMEMHWGA